MNSIFVSCGSYLPKKVITNDDLSKIVDTNDEWIVSRTGIKSRHIADESESSSEMGCIALKNALSNANLSSGDIDGIIVATSTPDLKMPSTACIIQEKIGTKNAFAFDLQAACSGFVYGVSVANSMIKSGLAKRIAVIGVDKMSKIVDWSDRNTCVLFGDGSGCFILERSENVGIMDTKLISDGHLVEILKTNERDFIQMNGKEVFKYATSAMEGLLVEILEKNNIKPDELSAIVCHQANMRIISHVAKKMNIDIEKFPATMEVHGNTSAASIPLAFEDFYKSGKIKKNDLVAMVAVGAGMTAGVVLMRV